MSSNKTWRLNRKLPLTTKGESHLIFRMCYSRNGYAIRPVRKLKQRCGGMNTKMKKRASIRTKAAST